MDSEKELFQNDDVKVLPFLKHLLEKDAIKRRTISEYLVWHDSQLTFSEVLAS